MLFKIGVIYMGESTLDYFIKIFAKFQKAVHEQTQ